MKYLNVLQGLRLIKNKREVIKHLFNLNEKKLIKYELKNKIKFLVPNLKKNRSTILSINEIFKQEIYPIKESNEERLILDIGAQSGIFSIYALYRNNNAKIYSFEPDPENFIQLKENIKENKLDKNIYPINKAVSGKNGKISFYIHLKSSRANSIYKEDGQRIEVESITLEKVFADLKIKKCDILKIDIEGAEYDTLYNCPRDILNKINIIFIECHEYSNINKIYNKKSMIKFLSKNNFKVLKENEGIIILKNKGKQ